MYTPTYYSTPFPKLAIVVDNEKPIRLLIKLILNKLGIEVLEAGRGDEALSLVAMHPGAIELAIVDVYLPDLPGQELTRRLQMSRPELRVIETSGGFLPQDLFVEEADRRIRMGKPFTPELLRNTLRRLISRPLRVKSDRHAAAVSESIFG